MKMGLSGIQFKVNIKKIIGRFLVITEMNNFVILNGTPCIFTLKIISFMNLECFGYEYCHVYLFEFHRQS